MDIDTLIVPAFPTVLAALSEAGSTVTINGNVRELSAAASLDQQRAAVVAAAAAQATAVNRPVRLNVTEAAGEEVRLAVRPNAVVDALDECGSIPVTSARSTYVANCPQCGAPQPVTAKWCGKCGADAPFKLPVVAPVRPMQPVAAPSPMPSAHSPISPASPENLIPSPAEAAFPLPVWRPSPVAVEATVPVEPTAADERTVLAEPVAIFDAQAELQPAAPGLPDEVVMIANLKGGAGKTPLAVTLAMSLARRGGHSDVSVVEINPRGTLAARTQTSPTAGSIVEFARESAVDPQLGLSLRSLEPFTSWQPDHWLTVTCPVSIVDPSSDAFTPPLAEGDLGRVVEVLKRTQHVIIFDTGNSDADPTWQEAARLATRLVIPVQWDADTMRMAQQMLSDLFKAGHADLARTALIVGTHAPRVRPDRRAERSYRAFWAEQGFTVLDLTPDPHIEQRRVIEWSRLKSRTRQAVDAIAGALVS